MGAVVVAAAVGYVSNIVYVIQHVDAEVTNQFILACAGVAVPPVGIVHGFGTLFGAW
jgi:hypothetical protein